MDAASFVISIDAADRLAERLAKALKCLHSLSSMFINNDVKIIRFITDLASLHAVVGEIGNLVEDDFGHDIPLVREFKLVFECATTVVFEYPIRESTCLEENIDILVSVSQDGRTLAEQARMMTSSSAFDDYSARIAKAASEMVLLFTALQRFVSRPFPETLLTCSSCALLRQQHTLDSLDGDRSADAKSETSSLYVHTDDVPVVSDGLDDSDLSQSSVSFDFDTEILGSKTYTAAQRSSHIRALRARRSARHKEVPLSSEASLLYGRADDESVLSAESDDSDSSFNFRSFVFDAEILGSELYSGAHQPSHVQAGSSTVQGSHARSKSLGGAVSL